MAGNRAPEVLRHGQPPVLRRWLNLTLTRAKNQTHRPTWRGPRPPVERQWPNSSLLPPPLTVWHYDGPPGKSHALACVKKTDGNAMETEEMPGAIAGPPDSPCLRRRAGHTGLAMPRQCFAGRPTNGLPVFFAVQIDDLLVQRGADAQPMSNDFRVDSWWKRPA